MGVLEEIAYTALGFVIGSLFEEFILEPIVGPLLRHRYTYLLKAGAKKLKNNETVVEVIGKSSDISAMGKEPMEVADGLESLLRSRPQTQILRQGSRIVIQSISYGKTNAQGTIEIASYPNRDSLRARSFEVALQAPCEYNKFSEGILELSRCLEEVNDVARSALNSPLVFQNYLTCNLKGAYEITGVLSDLKANYLMFGGDVEVTFGKTNVSFAKMPFSIEAIDKMKKLVTLFG